jgi:hypothetical protein
LVIHRVGQGLKKLRLHLGVVAVAHRRNLPRVLLLLPPLCGDNFFLSLTGRRLVEEGKGSRLTRRHGGNAARRCGCR